jgi:hypothetical protein
MNAHYEENPAETEVFLEIWPSFEHREHTDTGEWKMRRLL